MTIVGSRILPIPDEQILGVPVVIGNRVTLRTIEIIYRGKTVRAPEGQLRTYIRFQFQPLDRKNAYIGVTNEIVTPVIVVSLLSFDIGQRVCFFLPHIVGDRVRPSQCIPLY